MCIAMHQAHYPYTMYRENMENNTMTEKITELLTVREVAQRLRVDETTVRRWIKTGALEAITLPNQGKRHSYRVR